MNKYILLLIYLTTIKGLPIQFPFLQTQGTLQQQQLALQEQMMAIQQFQALQNMNLIPAVNRINTSPLLLLVPTQPSTQPKETRPKRKPASIEDTDADSITIDAQEEELESDGGEKPAMKAFLLVPNARFSLGGIISQIPFLPIEINVPDSISWIYNSISGWISGWGMPQSQKGEGKGNWKVRQPVLVMPLGSNGLSL